VRDAVIQTTVLPNMEWGFWRAATARPEAVAIVDGAGNETSYGELLAMSRSLAAGLRERGGRRGDVVAAVLGNEPAFFATQLAAFESGLYFTPVNTHLAAPEIDYVVADCEPVAVVTGETIPALLVPGAGAPPERSPGLQMMYTSGTTGKPKGVKKPLPVGDPDDVHGGNAARTAQGFGVPLEPHRHLVCGPLYHAGPFVGAGTTLQLGATVVLLDKWSPEGFLAAVERHRIATTQMVPTMFHRLLALPEAVRDRYDVSSLRSVFHTGAPCPVDVKQRLMDWWGPVVYETYGGTESIATIATPKRWLSKPGTVGRPINGVTLHILDDDGYELGSGETGEIWIDSGVEPPEYHGDPDKTARMRRGGLVSLGDIGFVDADGCLFLRDRKIDLIISGGVNVYPAEVESALLADPRVGDAVVIGAPDPEWGEQVVAIVEPADGVVASGELAASLLDECRARIAAFKCPRRIDFVATLPRLPNGKVEKRRLRDAYWAGTARAI